MLLIIRQYAGALRHIGGIGGIRLDHTRQEDEDGIIISGLLIKDPIGGGPDGTGESENPGGSRKNHVDSTNIKRIIIIDNVRTT